MTVVSRPQHSLSAVKISKTMLCNKGMTNHLVKILIHNEWAKKLDAVCDCDDRNTGKWLIKN